MAKLVIFGDGDLAQVAHFYFSHDSEHEIVAFTVNEKWIRSREAFGLPVHPFERIQEILPPEQHSMFVAIGYSGVNKTRARIYQEAKAKGYRLESYVCSRSTVWEKPNIGDNCFILEDVTIQPFVKIGSNVVVWSGDHIGHHSTIGDHCFITSHVVISGNCKIGDYSFLGVNATLRDGITIGRSNVIGAGALIMKDTEDEAVFTGHTGRLFPKKSSELDL
jgi:sugar O-acyltransferase (sialic acid O-acetyltransferase NeuD family)